MSHIRSLEIAIKAVRRRSKEDLSRLNRQLREARLRSQIRNTRRRIMTKTEKAILADRRKIFTEKPELPTIKRINFIKTL